MSSSEPLLRVANLSTSFETDRGAVKAVSDVSFSVGAGETLAIVGESGSGKSVTCLSILRLLSTPPASISGSVKLRGTELLELPEREMRAVRGKDVAMVFQEPMTSLNPVFTVGNQIAEAVRIHEGVARRIATNRAVELLELVGIPEPNQRAREYPHQLSGGMRQRVMIAIALACRPELLIADEPTTALDVTIQAQIIDLLGSLQKQFGMGLLFVTHDLGVVAEIADRVLVMYAGMVVEEGTVDDIFLRPKMPYTSGLLQSVPRPGSKRSRLAAIAGEMPDPGDLPTGCGFHPRCDHVTPDCSADLPALEQVSGSHCARCFRWRVLDLPSIA
ncbi:MAG: ABC transporter ATP-binding protein [Rhodothermales bacterium]|nr:ABC transporter ATP-binding protein [Rhodothermales bacterium]